MTEAKSYINITNKNNYIKTIHGIFNISVLDNRFAVSTEFSLIDKNLYLIVPCGNLAKNPTVNLNTNLNSFELRAKQSPGNKTFCVKKKTKWVFKKFKYHGKGYKVKKVNNLSKITFRLGRSHWTKLLFNKSKITVKRTKKNSYTVLSIKKKNLNVLGTLLKQVKGVNTYTKRGVRLSRQDIKKRYGKVSQANSVYK